MSDFVINGNVLVGYSGYGERVDIPEGVTGIDKEVFMDCDFLEKAFMPKSLKVINDRAFMGCTSLKKVYIPGKLDRVGDKAFELCNSLKDIVFFKPIDDIGADAFEGTLWLNNIRKKKGCAVIGDILVDGRTYSKYSALRIQSGIKVIAPAAFKGNRELMKVTLEEGVISIGADAFRDCGILSDIIIPKSVTKIGSGAFDGTLWIESKRAEDDYVTVNDIIIDAKSCKTSVVTISSKIKVIGEMAFEFNDFITKVVIHDGVKKIGCRAFCNCKNLQSVTIPDSVAEFGEDIFEGSDKVQITYKGKNYTADNFDDIRR